jgi:hypothetical protein
MAFPGMLCHVALVRTDVSEELTTSIIRVTRIVGLGTTLAVTTNQCTLHGVTSQKTPFINDRCVRLEFSTAVTMQIALFRDVMPCGSCKNRRILFLRSVHRLLYLRTLLKTILGYRGSHGYSPGPSKCFTFKVLCSCLSHPNALITWTEVKSLQNKKTNKLRGP